MMKKLIYPFLFLFTLSCDPPVRPELHPGPNPENLAKQQAPFGNTAVDVKLKKVSDTHNFSVEYIYEGDVLTEQRQYDATNYLREYQVGKYSRKDKLPEKYDVTRAYFDAQTNGPTTYSPKYSISFLPPVNDSIRQIKREEANNMGTFLKTYAFDKEGYIIRREDWPDIKSNVSDNFHYVRDSRHNVIKMLTSKTGEPKFAGWYEYIYDNNPNPFFKIGSDWAGDISIQSLSPNNVVKEIYHIEDAINYSITYTYEYLPNGYPKNVTLTFHNTSETPYSFRREFEY